MHYPRAYPAHPSTRTLVSFIRTHPPRFDGSACMVMAMVAQRWFPLSYVWLYSVHYRRFFVMHYTTEEPQVLFPAHSWISTGNALIYVYDKSSVYYVFILFPAGFVRNMNKLQRMSYFLLMFSSCLADKRRGAWYTEATKSFYINYSEIRIYFIHGLLVLKLQGKWIDNGWWCVFPSVLLSLDSKDNIEIRGNYGWFSVF